MVNTHAKCASPTPAKSPANPQKLQKKWRGTPTKGSLASDLYRCLREPTESLLRRAASVRHGRVDHDRVEAVVERIEKFSGRHEIEEIATRRRYHANSSAAIVEPGEKLVLCADVKAVDILKHNRSPIESRKVSVCARDPRHERHRQVGAERDYCRRRRRFLPRTSMFEPTLSKRRKSAAGVVLAASSRSALNSTCGIPGKCTKILSKWNEHYPGKGRRRQAYSG